MMVSAPFDHSRLIDQLTISLEEGRGTVLDYYGRCTRFWINSYATKNLQSSLTGLTPVQKNQIRTCVFHAGCVLDWPLDLSPFQKESLRYIPESGGIMVSFCCLFIIESCHTFGSSILDIHAGVNKVAAAAHLILSMAPDTEHCAHTQGLVILKRTECLRKQLRGRESSLLDSVGSVESNPTLGAMTYESNSGDYDWSLPENGMSAMELFWDFSS
jgi:hypothetical protein